ncbi:unnamed protein product, partial [Rhizoctonia solani]
AARGFGYEIAKTVLASGDKVVATVRSQPDKLAAQLNNPENLFVTQLDITDEEQARTAAGEAVAHFGRIDVLVNNAGSGLLSAVEEATANEVRRNFEINVFGVLNVIRAVLPYMRERRSGHVINISSIGGLSGYIGWGVYGAAKFAVEGLTEALALELAPLGIHATVVAPGFFRTDFLDSSSLSRSERVIDDYAATVSEMRSFAAQANHRQPGDPAKLGQAFVRLANAEKPPVHLLLGNDTLARYREKAAALETDIREWQDVVTSTDHDDARA